MTSFIIIAKDKAQRLAYAQEMCTSHKIHAFDTTIIERETEGKQISQSIGIDEVKKIQKKLFLKPIKSQQKAVIIEEANLLTPEAQNALPKVLEEPPINTLIFLNADTKEALLPTIHSRCQLIQLDETSKEIGEEETEEIHQFLARVGDMNIGERLKLAEQKAKDKNGAVSWIQNVMLLKREQLLKKVDDREGVILLRHFQKLYTIIKTTNINPRMAIENTLLLL